MYVVLNNKLLEIDGEIIEKQVNPFTAQLGSGTVEFKNFAPCSIEEYRDLRGGIGLESEEKPSQRLYWSDGIETSKEGYWTLGPLVVTAGALGAQPIKFADFGGSGSVKTYVIADDICSVWNTAGSGSWDDTDDGTALTDPTDMIVATDATATYLLVCNGTEIRYTSNGTSWSPMTTENIKYMAMFDKRLIGIDAAYKKLWYSPRENIDGTLASFNLSGDYSTITDLFTGKLLTTGEPIIYFLTDTGLFTLDFYTQTAYKMEVRYPSTTNARVGMYWNGYVYAGTGPGISRITPNMVDPDWGPDKDDGLPTDYQGYIYDMIGTSYWSVIAVAGGTKDSILKRHQSLGGWHQVYSSSSAIETIHWSPAYSPGRLWFGDGTNAKYVQFPDKTHDVTSVSGYTYATTGTLYLPIMSKVSAMPKIAVSVQGVTKSLDADETVTPSYIVDTGMSLTGGDWTALGAWSTSPRPRSAFGTNLGTAFYDMCIKLVFARGTTTTNTPKVKSFSLWYVPLPATVTAWSFKAKALGDKALEITTNLTTARDSTVLVNFSPDGDTNQSEKYVRIMTMPSKRWLSKYAGERDFTITVTEVE